MNFLRNTFVFFITSFIALAVSAAQISFNRSDFVSAKGNRHHGEILILAQLSDTGYSKVREFNKTEVGKAIEIKVAGETHTLLLREPIKGSKLEFGPFPEVTAKKIIDDINMHE
ncbi:MAG: hypothetical protein ACXVCP_02320 [Bdellovibrio sp.]